MIGERLAHYSILEPLGAGGMGVVYRARDERLKREVALKIVPPERADAVARQRLLNEARSASRLNHPHVCTVYEVGEADGHAYIAMEVVEGQPLSALVSHGGLAPDTVLHYGAQVASALAHAHQRGVIHRDLKASNVMVTSEGQAKVLDFGLAKQAPETVADDAPTRSDLSLTRTGTIAGTLPCMAPEQLRMEPADARTDVWALGVLLYEMTAGYRPFQGKTDIEVCSAILHEPPLPLASQVPPGLRAVIQRCLAKEPSLRYQLASELQAALEALRSSSGVEPMSLYRAPRTGLWVAGLLGATLLGATVAYLALTARVPPGMPSAGGRLTLLLSSEELLASPALSPDGKLLVYVAQDQEGTDLFLVRVAGGARLRLTHDPARKAHPAFSPDGERIAFTRRRSDDLNEVCFIATFGGDAVCILPGASDPSWSPDGSRIAFVYRQPDKGEGIATAAVDGSSLRALVQGGGDLPFVGAPAWSPDGGEITFTRSAGGIARQLWRVASSGGDAEQLTRDPAGVFSDWPVYTVDGGIIHVSNRGGANNLWLHAPGRKGPVRLTHGPGPDEEPSVARSGAVAFLNTRSRTALLVCRLQDGQSRSLFTHSSAVWGTAFSPDGREIAFGRMESDGAWHIWTVPAQGGPPRQLTSSRLPEIYPRYTPDGASLIFFTWGQEPNRIWRVARSGGVPVPITPARAEHDGYADISPDGRFVAFARTEGGVVRVHVMPVAGGEAHRLTASPSTVPRWSPDGKLIAFARDRAYDAGVFVIGADGGGERRLTQTGGWPVWWPDGARIAYSAIGADGNQEIRIVSSRGGPSTPLASVHYSGTNYTFDVSRDGASLVTSNITSSSTEVWVLEPGAGR